MEVPENRELEQEFWKTLELLVSREWKRTDKDAMADVQDWVEKFVARKESEKEEDDPPKSPKSQKSEEGSSGYGTGKDVSFKEFFAKTKLPKMDCKFSHPYVRSRLEKLMGSNVVSLTDRNYMMQLQQRIIEDYLESMEKRIASREMAESERVKRLVLTGKIPMDKAPPEMDNHPIKLIEIYCQRLIAERRAKLKLIKVHIPRHLYWDDTYDPPSGLSIEKGHIFRKSSDRLCHPSEQFIEVPEDQEIERGFMYTEEEFEKVEFESPLIKQLRECQTVEELYTLASEIIGALKTIAEDDVSAATTATTT